MTKTVTVIDYGSGNLWSVQSAIKYLGYECVVSGDPATIEEAEMLLLPGVGSFRKAMAALQELHLVDAIKEAVVAKERKILGICLGMQLLAAASSEDGQTEGFGFIANPVERLRAAEDASLKVPHVGFNRVKSGDNSVLFAGIARESDFYFVHSYRVLAEGLPGVASTCNYGEEFLAAYEDNNIFAAQFHPEKSQTSGLRLLRNFLTY